MRDVWWDDVDTIANWEDGAPFFEFPVDYSVEESWRWTRRVVPTDKGFVASWAAFPQVDIAWPGDYRLRYASRDFLKKS